MTHSTLWLSQIQFYVSLGFMALFLMTELGLAWMLAYFRIRALSAPAGAWMAAYRFWVRIFALAFMLGFAAGIPVLIQFGSLWPGLMDKIGDVAGPLLAAGIASVFLFKSTFLGAMLFGERGLSDRAHAAVTVMVAVGVTVMAFWLLALVSWTHVPLGADLQNGQYRVGDWMQVVFNPAMPWYGGMFFGASLLLAAFLIMGVIAAQSLRRPCEEGERLAFRAALRLACIGVALQIVFVAGAGQVAARYQPALVAATAGYWHSGRQPDLVLLGWPDTAKANNRVLLRWRHAGGRWLGTDQHGNLRGLDQFSGMTPPVAPTFFLFRLAIVCGLFLVIAAWITAWRFRRVHHDPGALSRGWRHLLTIMAFDAWVMVLAGIAYFMLGAYPYAVNGTITMAEVAGTTHTAALMAGTIAFFILYALFVGGFLHRLWHVARYGVVPVARRRGRA